MYVLRNYEFTYPCNNRLGCCRTNIHTICTNGLAIGQGAQAQAVHNKKRKIIELFGERWHKPEEEEQRITEFATSGYQVLVIWQKQLKVRDRKKLIERIRFFESMPEIKWEKFS